MWSSVAVIIPGLPLGAGFFDRAVDSLLARCEQLASLGTTGLLIFVGIYVLSSLLCLPCLPFTILAGAIFGTGWGTLAVMAGLAGGAAANFLIARHFGRGALARRLLARPRLSLVDKAVAREGWRIVALLRMCPIPFGFSNYVYGLTAIEFWHYLIATLLGLLPGTAVFVYFGARGMESIQNASEQGSKHPLQYLLMAMTVIAAIVVFAIIGRIVKRVVEQRID